MIYSNELKNFKSLTLRALTAIALGGLLPLCSAQAIIVDEFGNAEIAPNGQRNYVTVPAGFAGDEVSLGFYSAGNSTQIVPFYLEAPAGVDISVDSAAASGAITTQLEGTTGYSSATLVDDSGAKSSEISIDGIGEEPVPPTTGDGGDTGGDISNLPEEDCGGVDMKYAEDLRQLVIDTTGERLSLEQICYYIKRVVRGRTAMLGRSALSAAEGLVPNYGVGGKFVLHKDTCSVAKKGKYLVRAKLDIRDVPAVLRQSGFRMEVAFDSSNYGGKMAAALKPNSDGKYRGQPIFLLSTISFGNETVSVVEWSKGKIKKTKSMKVPSAYVSHRGQILSRIPAGKFMSGKKSVVELTDGYETYSVCFLMKKKRQNLNGYKQ